MRKYWDQFSELEVLRLAQLFVNIEWLGCKYCKEITEQVEFLAQNVPEVKDYRLCKLLKPSKRQNSIKSDWDDEEIERIESYVSSVAKFQEIPKVYNFRTLLKDVVLLEVAGDDQEASLNKTITQMQKVGKLDTKFDRKSKKFSYIFDGHKIAEGGGGSKENAKIVADEELMNTLKDNCFTIKSRDAAETDSGLKLPESLRLCEASSVDHTRLEINIEKTSDALDKIWAQHLIRNFKNLQLEYDLVFSRKFTKDDRAQIQE